MDYRKLNKRVNSYKKRSKARREYKVCLTSRQWHIILEAIRTAQADVEHSEYDGYSKLYDSVTNKLEKAGFYEKAAIDRESEDEK